MVILVSDTSVLIDLERGGLLEAVFSSGMSFAVPDLLYARELESDLGPYLRTLGLGVVSLTPDEVALAQRINSEHRRLSLPDCFALSCATRNGYRLVTGDGLLRKEGSRRLGEVYGLLWLLDQVYASGKVSPSALVNGLKAISEHRKARLPTEEVVRRLTEWGIGPG